MSGQVSNVQMATVNVTLSVQSDNPNTIAKVLARKLGREPTNAELKAEVDRILSDVFSTRR